MVYCSVQQFQTWQPLSKRKGFYSSPRSRQRRYRHDRLWLGCMLILFSGLGGANSQAQTPRENRLDAQHIQRQEQQQQQFLQNRLPSAEVTPLGPDLPLADRTRYPAETPCFPISSITLTGDSAGRFAWALNDVLARGSATDQLPSPIGQCLGAQGIELLANHVQNRIMAAGYVTSRVMVQPQNVGSGQLVLSLLPGRVQGIRFSDTSDIRAHRWNALPVSEGDVLNIRDLEQGLENFRRLPTVQADIQIAPASEPGQSDLIINWQQSRPIRLMATFDDAGSKSTGRYQGNLAFSLDHLFTLNDLFYVSHTRSLGSSAGGARLSKDSALHYSIPFGYWLFSVNGSSFNYRQPVAGINENMHVGIIGLGGRHAILGNGQYKIHPQIFLVPEDGLLRVFAAIGYVMYFLNVHVYPLCLLC